MNKQYISDIVTDLGTWNVHSISTSLERYGVNCFHDDKGVFFDPGQVFWATEKDFIRGNIEMLGICLIDLGILRSGDIDYTILEWSNEYGVWFYENIDEAVKGVSYELTLEIRNAWEQRLPSKTFSDESDPVPEMYEDFAVERSE